jgi:hypothetical protein
MFNTNNAIKIHEALNNIVKQMKNSCKYTPLAYQINCNHCSCCYPSQQFYIVCKTGFEFKILSYESNYNHENNCPVVRCNCLNPFEWKNITPLEKDNTFFNQYNKMEDFTSFNDDSWHEELTEYFIQYEENKKIYEYNETDCEYVFKNYAYYFSHNKMLS